MFLGNSKITNYARHNFHDRSTHTLWHLQSFLVHTPFNSGKNLTIEKDLNLQNFV